MENHNILEKAFGVILILIGIILYPTPIPFTSSFIILGLIFLIGKKETIKFLKKVLGEKIYKYLNIRKLINRFK